MSKVTTRFKDKTHVKLKGKAYVKFANEVFDRDGWACIECGNTQTLTVAHRIHKGMGGGNGPGDVLDNADCKCMSCHDKEERHLEGKIKR